jgi:hypothetical protein
MFFTYGDIAVDVSAASPGYSSAKLRVAEPTQRRGKTSNYKGENYTGTWKLRIVL